MATVLVLGGAVNGLTTALLLARDGHRVTVVERDPEPAPADPWPDWRRPGVPHLRMLHFLLPRWTRDMEDVLPDVLGELTARGGYRMNWLDLLAPARRGPRRPGDERLDTVTARRPVLEAAVRAVAERTPRIRLLRGVRAVGLDVTPGPIAPRVTGLRLGDGTVLGADLTVDCSGRGTAVERWLDDAGVSGIDSGADAHSYVYYCRHYRSEQGGHPECRTTLLQHHPSVSLVTLPADNGTWAVGFVGWSGDRALRALANADRFESALAAYPLMAHWGAPGRGVHPITPVQAMGGLRDSWRTLARGDEPAVTGLVLVGDSASFTNPAAGRGIALGLLQARCLREVLADVDPVQEDKLARRLAEAQAAQVQPYLTATQRFDHHRLREIVGDVTGSPYHTDDRSWQVSKAFFAAKEVDPDVLRGYSTVAALNAPAEQVLADADLASRVMTLGANAPQYPAPGASRAELLDALGTHSAGS